MLTSDVAEIQVKASSKAQHARGMIRRLRPRVCGAPLSMGGSATDRPDLALNVGLLVLAGGSVASAFAVAADPQGDPLDPVGEELSIVALAHPLVSDHYSSGPGQAG